MFRLSEALVPFFLPLGWGIGYAVTTGLKKVCDRFFPGEDSSKDQQAEEDHLFWTDHQSYTEDQNDTAKGVCGNSDSAQICPGDDGTVSGQTDPAGSICPETSAQTRWPLDMNSECRNGSDRSLVRRTPAAGLGQAEQNYKFANEEHNSWMNAVLQSFLNLGITRRCFAQDRVSLEAASIRCCVDLVHSAVHQPGKHFCQADLSPVLTELEKQLPSDVGRDFDVKCLLEFLLAHLGSLGGDTDRELYNANYCATCQSLFHEPLNSGPLISLPPVVFSTSLGSLLYYWLDLGGKLRCSGCGSALRRNHCLASNNVLVFFLHRLTRRYQVEANRTLVVPAACDSGTETYHLSSVICGDQSNFYTYLMKGGQTVKAEDEHVFTTDNDCSEDMCQNGLIYVYEKM